MSKTYIIIHGLNGSPEGHWQHSLYKKLLENGEKAYFPQFPNNHKPVLSEWLEELDKVFQQIDGEKVVVCHSLGVILWLHYAMKNKIENVSNLLLVAPPGVDALFKIKELNSFSNIYLSKKRLKRSANKIRLVATENDEYCVESAIKLYAEEFELDHDVLSPEKRHINMDSGYGHWDSVYKWCYDTNRRLED